MKTKTAAILTLLTTALASAVVPSALAGHRDGRGWVRCDDDRRHRPWTPAYGGGYEVRTWQTRYRPATPVLFYSRGPAGGDRGFWGAVIGGTGGGLLGSNIGKGSGRTAAIIGGAVLGTLVGGSVGRTMDTVDRLTVVRTLEYAPTREVVAWQNPDTRASYEVTPTETYRRDDGRYCREYQTRALIGGEWQQLYGTACRQPDGNWEVVR
jgi:surface antigen